MKKLAWLVALWALVASLSVHGQTYTWDQVRIGGSGNIPSFVAHPKVPDLYFVCTDVGTPYRWNKDLQKWEPIMLFSSIPVNYWNWEVNQRCGSIGVDPNDGTGNILYAVVSNSEGAGPGQGKTYPGTVLKSIDRGNSWTDLHVNISVNPNKSQTYGDRVLVDPRNSDVVWVVTDTTGAWRTDNAGSSWTQMSSVSMATEKLCSFILYDTSAGSVVVNSKTISKRIYIGRPSGVWVSNDGGQNFSLMPNSPAGPTRAVIHADGTLYVSATVWDVKKGVYKYRSGSWQDISPITLHPTYSVDRRVYCKVAVSPLNSDHIVVSTSGTWNKDPYYISTNGGAPGSYNQGMISRDNSEAPHSSQDGLYYNSPGHNANAFTWDPFYPNRVWINDMLDVLCTNNIFDPVANWKIRIIGLEEIVVTGPMVAPPSGKNVLMSVTADVGGAHHRSLTEPLYQGAVSYTAIASNIQQGLNSQSVAFQYTNPDFVVRVATDSWGSNLTSDSRAAYSTNGGDTYTRFAQSPGMRGRIAVSANSQNLVWLTQSDNGAPGNVYWSANLGSNWTKATGAPSGILPLGDQFVLPPGQNNLVADKVNGNYFYIWDRGNFYVSSDAGHSFSQTAATGLTANNGSNPNGSAYASATNVETTPGKTGDVWIAFYGGSSPYSGLYHTTDTGKTFNRVGDADFKPKWIAVALSDTTPSAKLALYVTSETQPINGVVYGAFRSDDTGRTWTTIANRVPGVVQNITADNRGRMILGISGDGIFYGAPVSGPVQVVEITNAASDTLVAGYALTLKVKLTPAYPTNPAVTWSSSDTTKAKVDQFGKVTGVSAGTVTITATSVDGGITDTHTLTIIPPVVSASVVIDSTVYGTLQTPKLIAASLLPANTTNKTLTWSVGNTAIAKVTSNGIVTGLQLGTTTLTVAGADGGASRTVPLIITTIVTATDAGSGAGTTPYGQFIPEGPTGTDKRWHAGYTWVTSMSATTAIDTSFVTNPAPLAVYRSMRVSKVNGTNLRYYMRDLIPNATYTVRLHFIEPDNANKANHTFSVKANGSADSLVDYNIYQAAGNRLNTAVIHTMQVKANSAGVIEVYFYPKVGAGDPYMAFVSGVEVRINPLTGIAISSPNDTISVNFTDTLRLTTNPLNATNRNLVYASSNEAVATVSLTGVVTAKSAGTVTITATSVEGSFTSTKTYIVVYTSVTAVNLNTASDSVFVGATRSLTATVLPAKASNKAVVWTSSDTTIAKVSNTGVVSGLKQGNVVITAASAETPSIKAQANVYVFNVLATAVSLTPSPAIIGERDTLLVKPTFTPANTSIRVLAWSSSDTSIASVDANGIILARKQGTATVTAVTTDGSNVTVNLPVTIVPFDSCGGIKNPGFESDMIEWLRYLAGQPTSTAVYTVSGMGHTGDKAVSLGFTNDNTSMNLKGSVPVTGGSVIVLSQWVKVVGTSGQYPWWAGYGMGFVNSSGTAVQADSQKVLSSAAAYRDQWALIRDTLTVPDSATGFTYWVSKVGPGTVWLDDFCIQTLTTNNTAIYAVNVGSEQNYTNLPPTPYDSIAVAQFQPEGAPSPVNKWHGGYTWIVANNNAVDVSGVDRPAPLDVYKYIRYSKVNITPVRYYLRNLTPNTYYGIRLHFLEVSNTDKLNRIFSVKATNGIDSLIDFVPYTAAGNALNKVVIRTIRAKADANGLIVVYLYPKSGTYDPYSASLAALELCTLASQPAARNMQPIAAIAADKPALALKASVFPNPSLTGFTVQITAASQAPVLLTVTDNAGRQVHTATVYAGKAYQFGNKLKAGVYHLRIQQGHEHYMSKLVKL